MVLCVASLVLIATKHVRDDSLHVESARTDHSSGRKTSLMPSAAGCRSSTSRRTMILVSGVIGPSDAGAIREFSRQIGERRRDKGND